MNKRDRELGMGRQITRRDFLQGSAVAAGGLVGTALAGSALTTGCSDGGPAQTPRTGPAGLPGVPPSPDVSPPSRLGLRGSHAGSFEVAHEMAFERRSDWGHALEADADEYDLIVVGGGVSGLAAAIFHREQNPGARVLVLDNHDDFGGHAKRNAFEFEGRTILGYGGSQSLEAPGEYSDEVKGLFGRLGIEPKRLAEAYDLGFCERHGLGAATYFDAATWGSDRVVRGDMIDSSAFIPMAKAGTRIEDEIAQMPMSEHARGELLRIYADRQDVLPEHSLFAEPGYLNGITYLDFLTKHLEMKDPQVTAFLQDLPSNYMGHGIDVIPALDGLLFGLPGLRATSLGSFEGLARKAIPWLLEPYTFHFPDGNASVARIMVRHLIPGAAPGSSMDDVVAADFDYSRLDRTENDVRLRLDSMVVRVQHDGSPESAERVHVTYVRGGRTEQVTGRKVVLACYNAVIPHLCPELPQSQRAALSSLVKTPLVYTNVLLRNWRAFEKLGVGIAHCPGSWHPFAMIDFPVTLGGSTFSPTPDDPVIVHMAAPIVAPGLPPRAQSRAGRHRLLQTPFETIEREVRTHLGGMLGPAGFDPATDIVGIAANRWPHGYSWAPNSAFDPEYAAGEAPHELGRKTFGRIAIANSDAGARAYLDEAINQAWRAVGELNG